ncbi:YybH family protein [Pseudofulvibacter geojedonensis]|uniref:YybH family protein n=1 Tax=Pseudofulvibacter geojedonensis TaxID=1123758 RepID=A0ABW3I599_9FLAO
MFQKITFSVFFLITFSSSLAQTKNDLNEINAVWEQFYQAFNSLDASLMANIHSKKLIRISGGNRIKDYKTYIDGYKKQFKKAREDKTTNKISLRFFERIANDSIASERGIYKLERKEVNKELKIFYGQFHVLLAKENGNWKIIMDYDSNENNSIGEEEYRKAYGINNLDAFIKK